MLRKQYSFSLLTHSFKLNKYANHVLDSRASEVVLVVKNLPAKAGDVRNMGLISG